MSKKRIKRIKRGISKTRINKRIKKKTNPELKDLILNLKKRKKQIWVNIAKYLARPRRKVIKVNIEKINKLTKNEETVIVPGKVLGKGDLDHKLIIAAFKFSKKSREKLAKNAEILTIPELADKLKQFKVNIKIII